VSRPRKPAPDEVARIAALRKEAFKLLLVIDSDPDRFAPYTREVYVMLQELLERLPSEAPAPRDIARLVDQNAEERVRKGVDPDAAVIAARKAVATLHSKSFATVKKHHQTYGARGGKKTP
jgi:hypothetical protein